jgi:hypothetical protein
MLRHESGVFLNPLVLIEYRGVFYTVRMTDCMGNGQAIWWWVACNSADGCNDVIDQGHGKAILSRLFF